MTDEKSDNRPINLDSGSLDLMFEPLRLASAYAIEHGLSAEQTIKRATVYFDWSVDMARKVSSPPSS
ncbi:MAG: hypothetical protein J0H19_18680 [Rhodospirillales bacterium]|nr:hypothetical protein [Rhodospirillales bacterium]